MPPPSLLALQHAADILHQDFLVPSAALLPSLLCERRSLARPVQAVAAS